jgi:hypothetical protein
MTRSPDGGDDLRVGEQGAASTSTTSGTTAAAPTTTAPAPPTTEGPGTTATTEAPPTTAPPTSAPPDTRPPPTTVPSGGGVDGSTPLSRSGIGPIRAGMTLREAQAASGNSLAPDDPLAPESTCGTASVAGTDLWLLLTRDSAADPLDSVIRSVQGGRSTVEGIRFGSTVDDLAAAYGQPTRSYEYLYETGAQVHVYEAGGYAYSATVHADGTVFELESGHPDAVGNAEGCA